MGNDTILLYFPVDGIESHRMNLDEQLSWTWLGYENGLNDKVSVFGRENERLLFSGNRHLNTKIVGSFQVIARESVYTRSTSGVNDGAYVALR